MHKRYGRENTSIACYNTHIILLPNTMMGLYGPYAGGLGGLMTLFMMISYLLFVTLMVLSIAALWKYINKK